MTYNFRALTELREWAAQSPDFDPKYWVAEQPCGTTLCLAGHVAVQAGYKIIWPPKRTSEVRAAVECRPPGKPKRTISQAAQEVLGLSEGERYQLFIPPFRPPEESAHAEAVEKLNRKAATDFLAHLTSRALLGMGNMNEPQIIDWFATWNWAHDAELRECGIKEES